MKPLPLSQFIKDFPKRFLEFYIFRLQMDSLTLEQVFSLPEFTLEQYLDLNKAKIVTNFYLNRLNSIILFHNDDYLNKKDTLFSEADDFNQLYTSSDRSLKQTIETKMKNSLDAKNGLQDNHALETRFDYIRLILLPPFPVDYINSQEELDRVQGFFDSGLSVSGFIPVNPDGITLLNLSYFKLRDGRIKNLAVFLRKTEVLTDLILLSNNIGVEEMMELKEALGENKSIVDLNLSKNILGDDGAKVLTSALRKNTTLYSLNLGDNGIRDEGAIALAELLENNTLNVLILSNNELGDEGATALASTLKNNTTLSILELEDNRIGDNGATALAESLEENKTLKILTLENNEIRDDGAIALAKLLEKNTTLEILNLNYNFIGDGRNREGIKALIEALKKNSTLSILALNGNFIGVVSYEALREEIRNRRVRLTYPL